MSRLCGAGVLPFCRHDGRVLFLLAKERYVPHWRGSSRWSGFEGGVKADESAIDNAVREFCEESICIMDIDLAKLACDISQAEYAMRVNIVSESRRNPYALPSLHSTFVKEFEYDEALPQKFERRRECLLALQQAGEALLTRSRALPEERYPFYREGHRIDIGETAYVVAEVADVGVRDGCCHVRLDLHPAHPALDATGPARACTKRTLRMALADAHAPSFHAYKAWFDARAAAEDALQRGSVPEESVVVERGRTGRVCTLHVLPEYLEKTCVRYWDLHELAESLKTRTPPSDVFRPYFILVIRTVLTHFCT